MVPRWSRRRFGITLGALALGLILPAAVRGAEGAQDRYLFRANHDPDGIGKFYMGREIAQVMGHAGVSWLERPERDTEEAPNMLIQALKLKPGMIVADIGAGSGFLSFRMAPHLLPGGKVLAEDIQPEMLDVIRQRVKEKSVPNVEPVLGTPTDPKLPPNSVDMILLVDVYHEFSEPWEMTVNMVKTLKPGGRLVFVEYRKENRAIPIKEVHKMAEAQVKSEMASHPLKWLYTSEILPRQHIIVFEKVNPKAPRRPATRTGTRRNQ